LVILDRENYSIGLILRMDWKLDLLFVCFLDWERIDADDLVVFQPGMAFPTAVLVSDRFI
jgi:hypothetical protein